MPEEDIISRIYEGHESKEKVQYIKCTERNPGLISQKEKDYIWLWFCWLSGKIKNTRRKKLYGCLQKNTLGDEP